jgi:hypothetical protein
MSASFLDDLRSETNLFGAIESASRVVILPVFIDLCWGEHFDFLRAMKDPGIQFDMERRRFVLMRIDNEIRYYAGTSDPYAQDAPYEIGIFPNTALALSFGGEYLIQGRLFEDITIERIVRSSSSTQ